VVGWPIAVRAGAQAYLSARTDKSGDKMIDRALAAKFANTVLLRGQATHTPCLQEVFAGGCHARAMTPSSGRTVSTAAPEPHGGKRIDEC
jgi:hypothetical protein